MATRYRYGFDKNNKLMDVTGTNDPFNTVTVMDTRPVVEGMTIDRGLMNPESVNPQGQFRGYDAMDPRPVGSMPGGERSVVTRRGAAIMEAADRRLMGGYGGVRVNDGQFGGTDAQGQRTVVTLMPEGFAPIMTNDSRLALSPQAVGAIGQRQIMEDKTQMRGPVSVDQMGRRLSVRKQLQAQADQGFVRPGTDAVNREQMRGTLQNANVDWLERNRPGKLMERGNTASQIMTQAEASLMTPQVSTQDGVMAGWDPKRREIVSDASGAKAIAQGRIQEAQIAADAKLRSEQKPMTYGEMGIEELTRSFNDTLSGTKIDPTQQLYFVADLARADTPEKRLAVAQKYKTPMSEKALVALQFQMDEISKRHGQPSSSQGKKTLGGIQAR